jgi:hypothetical protein
VATALTVLEPGTAAEIADQEIDPVLAARAAEARSSDKPAWKRSVVRTGILLAHPMKR